MQALAREEFDNLAHEIATTGPVDANLDFDLEAFRGATALRQSQARHRVEVEASANLEARLDCGWDFCNQATGAAQIRLENNG
jgi:ribosome-associated toxin RatA of RatAB toxin-antitoxin module